MEKLQIKRSGLYEIEVNDNGDTIVFDLEDIEMPLKFQNTVKKLNELSDKIRTKELVIRKKQDVPGKVLLSKNEEEIAKLNKYAFEESRKIMDEFLGEGACYKIFGDVNYISMFDDLMKALEPHFEKMREIQQHSAERIKQKYKEVDSTELS